MNKPFATVLLASLAAPAALTAQIQYVDATVGTGGNTTLADGTVMADGTDYSSTSTANDGLWNLRAFANGGTIISSNDVNVPPGGEDAPMLRTTITGLTPGADYEIYAYVWNADNASWRLRALVDTVQPAPEIPGYNSYQGVNSVFAPSIPLTVGARAATSQFPVDLMFDPNTGLETEMHFLLPTAGVLIQEGNRYLYEIPLGIHTAQANGEIWVFIDDLANNINSNRTWYDGVGVGLGPLPEAFGSGCNSGGTTGLEGETLDRQPVNVTLSGAPTSAPATLVIGFSRNLWNGIPLPLDLGVVGFPGCPLNVAYNLGVPLATDPNGEAALVVNQSGLVGVNINYQWIGIGPAGLFTTNGFHTTVRR